MKPTDRGFDNTIPDSSPGATEPRSATRPSGELAHYELGHVIGRGGMGEVVKARDLRIGRDVAIKRMRGAGNDEAVVRFLREAKIQARLDHPAIVPVHEIGTDVNGEPYFTMKRLVGVTLATMLAEGRESRQRLLRAFVDVALAIDLAHTKHIVHRDLKPANIMLGDFGEVYVLDWGLARDIDESVEPVRATSSLATPALGVTAIGSLLGTPGYMPPEQIRDASSVGLAADSYALGSILFEILTGEPLHPREDPITSTLEGVEPSPRRRCPDKDIPPELDRLCCEALATEPKARPGARTLSERVQQYLDGDRDLAMRRALATTSLDEARTALAAHRHEDAMRAAGHALALDPSSPAAEIVTRLMLEPPDDSAAPLAKELEAAELVATAKHARQATWMFLAFVPLVVFAVWNGVRSWPLIGSIAGLACVLAFSAHRISLEPVRAQRELWAYAVGNAAMLALLARLSSPFIIAPGAAAIVIMAIVTYPAFARRAWLVIGGVVLGWMIPVGLELLSIVRSTWDFVDDKLIIQSYALDFKPSTTVFLLVLSMAIFFTASALAVKNMRTNREMQRQLIAQRWRLSHLIPRPA